jgi:hypothetical protein
VRYVLSKGTPPFTRVLFVESGPRHLTESLFNGLYNFFGPELVIDLVTCYAGEPAGFRHATGQIYRVGEYAGSEGRARLYLELAARKHTIIGIICSDDPIMTKWKWMLALRTPAKLFILNENGDYFWLDYSQWRTIKHFILFRAGLSGAGAVRTIARLILFPFTVLFLILYAALIHLKRKVHT